MLLHGWNQRHKSEDKDKNSTEEKTERRKYNPSPSTKRNFHKFKNRFNLH